MIIQNFSFFKKPITNKRPFRTVNLYQVYLVIKSHIYEGVIKKLRSIKNKEEQRKFKCKNLDFLTPSGTFSYHSDDSLIQHSGILCVDLDHLQDVEGTKRKLLDDDGFDSLLVFRSPCGDGLKWFIAIDLDICDHKTWFKAVRNYLLLTYGLTEKQVDKSCSNVSKACYLSHDPDAYFNKKLFNQINTGQDEK